MGAPSATIKGFAVVTGASSGIGTALARSLAKRGHPLMLVARRGELLARFAEGLADQHQISCEVRAVDLADRVARSELSAELAERPVAILCNNAGVASFGTVASMPAEQLRAELELDANAVHELALAVIPGMVERGSGGLLFSGSIAGNLPIPHNATYSAAKAFVNHFAEALHHELKPHGVSVTLFAPGPVRARTIEQAGEDHGRSILSVSADHAAEVALTGLARNRMRVVPGLGAGALSMLTQLGPQRVLSPLCGRLYDHLTQAKPTTHLEPSTVLREKVPVSSRV